jgi:hypothetical protein
MQKIENHCVDCGLPCLGSSCPKRNVTVFYCDKCGDETTLYHFDDEELCLDCIQERLEVVEGSDD